MAAGLDKASQPLLPAPFAGLYIGDNNSLRSLEYFWNAELSDYTYYFFDDLGKQVFMTADEVARVAGIASSQSPNKTMETQPHIQSRSQNRNPQIQKHQNYNQSPEVHRNQNHNKNRVAQFAGILKSQTHNKTTETQLHIQNMSPNLNQETQKSQNYSQSQETHGNPSQNQEIHKNENLRDPRNLNRGRQNNPPFYPSSYPNIQQQQQQQADCAPNFYVHQFHNLFPWYRVDDADFYVMKSSCVENVVASIHCGYWASTGRANRILAGAYTRSLRRTRLVGRDCPVFLLFSVKDTYGFCGIVRMTGPVNFSIKLDIWNGDWQGGFPVEWIHVKDVPRSAFLSLQRDDLYHYRNCQKVNCYVGHEMLRIFEYFPCTPSVCYPIPQAKIAAVVPAQTSVCSSTAQATIDAVAPPQKVEQQNDANPTNKKTTSEKVAESLCITGAPSAVGNAAESECGTEASSAARNIGEVVSGRESSGVKSKLTVSATASSDVENNETASDRVSPVVEKNETVHDTGTSDLVTSGENETNVDIHELKDKFNDERDQFKTQLDEESFAKAENSEEAVE